MLTLFNTGYLSFITLKGGNIAIMKFFPFAFLEDLTDFNA